MDHGTCSRSFNEANQEFSLQFIYAKFAGLKKKEIGSVKIKVRDLISKLSPLSNWGTLYSPVSLEFNIEHPEHPTEPLGKISLKFTRGHFQNFPAFNGNWETYVKEKTKKIEANLQNYKFPDIYEVKRVLLRRAFLAPKLDNSLVTPVHRWILEEVDLLFGLSNHNAEISLLDVFSRNVRLLVTFADQFGKSYDTATKLVETNLKQIEKINKIMENTEKKILDIILNFKDKFPRGKPEGALQNVLTIYDTILCRHKKHSYEEYIEKLNELVERSLRLDYEMIKKQQMEAFKTEEFNAKVLISMIPIITFKLDRLYDFSSIFPEEIKYEQKNWIYYELFKKDFSEIESKNGFTGYQMLHFCAKLKPLEEIVECSTDLCGKKSELLNVHVISKGYEEKFISELYEKLSNCAQQSILVDNWLPVNEEVKHSTSVVDFYSTAHETWLFVSGLEFFNEHLLELFTEMLGKVTFEYANKVKNLAVSVLTKNTKQGVNNEASEKSSNKLQLFKKKQTTNDNDNTSIDVDEPYSEITITKDFLIMLNDIEVSKQELEEILQSVTEKQQAMKDSQEIEKKMEEQEKEESQKDQAVSKATPSDDEVTDFENDQSIEKSLSKYHQIGEAQISALEKSKTSLDILIESLLAIIASNFRIPIRKALGKIMSNARKVLDQQKGVTRPLSKQATLDLLQKDSDKILSEDIIDPILTPAFELLSVNCYAQLFKLLIEKVLDILNFEMLYTFVIPIENYDIELDKDKFLTVEQVYLMESCHVAIGLYFCGNDDDPNTGIAEETLEKNSRLLKRIFSLYESSSSKLINIYEKYVKYPNLNFTNTLKKHHILLLLKTKRDPEAVNFYKKHQREAEKERIIQVFNLKPIEGTNDEDESNDRYEEILVSLNGIYEMTPYDIHVTELRLLLEAKYSRKTREFLLKDIRNAKLNKSLLSTKGIQFTIASENNAITRYITFTDANVRTKFINVISQQLKIVGNEQPQLVEEVKSPTTSSSASGSKKVESSIFDQASDALKSKFKIKNSNCKLLRRIVCQSAYKEGQVKTYISGEILLFNHCFGFHCFSDGVQGTFSFKANFSIVKNIQLLKRKDNSGSEKIKIELAGGYTVSFYNIDDAQLGFKDISEAWEQWKTASSVDAAQLEKYKKNDDKVSHSSIYF